MESSRPQIQADRAWMLQFLSWNLPVSCLLLVLIWALFLQSREVVLFQCTLIGYCYVAILAASRWLTLRGRSEQAAVLLLSSTAPLTISAVWILPILWPTSVLLLLVAILVALPLISPQLRRSFFLAAWVLSLILIMLAGRAPREAIDLPFIDLLRFAVTGTVIGFVLLLLWQYHQRLSGLIAQTSAANQALQRAKADLELQVHERTAALRASEARYRASSELYRILMQHLPDTAILMFDTAMRYVVAEGPLFAQIGYRAAELVGRPVEDAMPSELGARAVAAHRRVLSGEDYATEKVVAGRTLQIRLTPIRDGEGAIIAGMAILQDVTERKAAERAVHDERDFAMALMTTMGQGLSVTDSEGRYVYVNPAFGRMTGYAPETMIGRSVQFVTPADDLERLRSVHAQRKAGASTSYEMRMRRADGEEIYVLISGVPRIRDGQYIGNIAVITDLTDRQRMEQALQDERDFAQSVMDTVGQGLIVTAADGRYEYVNPAFARLLGYERAELVGKYAYDISFSEDWELLKQTFEQRREGGANSYEMRMRRADGEPVYVLVTGVPRWRDGQFVGSIAVITDLTERKRIEGALAFARDQAVTASRLKSEFLATMSHEIRTPLNAIIGMSDVLETTELTREQLEYTELIRASGRSLLALISDILDIAKIEAGRLELDQRPFELAACVDAAVGLFAAQAATRQLTLDVTIDEGAPSMLMGDPERLGQVLANLIGNAVKFTERGGVTLTVGGHVEVEGGPVELLFAVHDTGPGIPRQRLGDIFEPFVQVDATTTRRHGGTGLGLAICRRLVELMGGTIWVTSEVGRGSSFYFTCRLEPRGASWDESARRGR